MQVEDVARIGLAARRAAQQQRHLAIRHGLLRQVVVEDHRMHRVVAEELAHRAAGVGREELHRRRVGRGGGHHDRVLERAVLLQRLHELGDGGALLTDGDVDAVELLALVAAGVDALLVDDGVQDHGGLAGLAVTDHQLALAAADRDQGVDRLDAGLHRLMHGFARDDARRLHLDAGAVDVGQRALAVDRVAERVDDAAEQPLANRHVHDRAGAGDGVALAHALVVAEDHDADIVGLEVERHALQAGGGKLHQLAGHDVLQPEDARDAVADGQHGADLRDVRVRVEVGDLTLEDLRDLGRTDLHVRQPPSSRTAVAAAWT
jgi:hypothetical protein